MKQALVIILILPITSLAQMSDVPFKKANTIFIESNLKSDTVFLLWGRHLAQNGYTIEKSDNSFYTITTGPKDPSKFNVDFITNSVIVNNGTIKIKIKWRVKSSILAGTTSTDYYEWEYASNKGNIQYVVHEDFLKIIRAFGGYAIKYSKE